MVSDGQGFLALSAGERATTEDGRLPAEPLPAPQDLIQLGDFTALSPDWEDTWREEDRSERPPRGIITPQSDGVYFKRTGDGNGHTILVQQINRPVWDFEELILTVRVKADISESSRRWDSRNRIPDYGACSFPKHFWRRDTLVPRFLLRLADG